MAPSDGCVVFGNRAKRRHGTLTLEAASLEHWRETMCVARDDKDLKVESG
jgi:hypothetical protein